MKKSRFFLWVLSLVLALVEAAAIFLAPKLWFVWAAARIALWAAAFGYFQTLSYEISGGNLRISSGFFFKRKRILPKKEILMTTRFALAGRLLFTVAYFSGGRVILFAELPL